MRNHNQSINRALDTDIEIDKDHWSQYSRDDIAQLFKNFEQRILLNADKKGAIFDFAQTRFFEIFIPELNELKKVPQNKQNSDNAFHHSLMVVSNVVANPVLKWAALLHDIGKTKGETDITGNIVSFRNHEYESFLLAKNILKRSKIGNKSDISYLVRFHSHPLDYQRQPNWKMSTIKRFCEKHGSLSIMLIDLAIADKISSSSKAEYLEQLYELRKMVGEIQY